MKLSYSRSLAVTTVTALMLASSINLLTATSALAETPATTNPSPATDNQNKPQDASKTSETQQAGIAVDEGTAITNEPALQALHQINAASAALDQKDIKAAQQSLNEADNLLKSFKDSLPTAKIREKLATAKENPDDTDWTSIYQQLNQIKLFLPKAMAKQLTNPTSKASEARPGTTDSSKASAPSAEDIEAVLVALQYTEIDLPVKSAIHSVEKAQAALKKEDIKTAANTLKGAENSVIVLQGVSEDPLVQAHLSIWQALANMKNHGSITEAKRYLADAMNFLHKAAQSTDKATQEAASKLLEEGESLQTELTRETRSTRETSKIVDKLEKFGRHTEAWAERAMNYTYAKASEATGNALKDNLIEARFHISNASIDLDTVADPAAARQELEQAQQSLKQALQQTDDLWSEASYKQQVTDMQTQLDQLLQKPSEQLADGSRLRQFKQTLQTIILKI